MATTISRTSSPAAPVVTSEDIDDVVTTPQPAVASSPTPDGFQATGPEAAALRTLDPAVKQTVSQNLAALNDPTARRNLTELVATPGFRALSKESQQEAVKSLMKAPGDPAYAQDLKALVNDGGPYATLQSGSSGPAVKAMQEALKKAGSDPGPVDGKFGPSTQKALKDFQQKNGLAQDGVAGPQVLGELNHKSFSGLDQASQAQLLQALSTQTVDPGARAAITTAATSPGFRALSAADRSALLTQVSGTSKESVTARATLKALVDDPAFATASSDQQAAKLTQFVGTQRSVGDLTKTPNFQALTDGLKTRALNDLRTNGANPAYVRDLNTLVADPRFGAMSTDDKTRLLNVFENTTPAGRQALQNLVHRDIAGGPALQSRGTTASSPTLLEQLSRQATTPLDARLPNAGAAATRAALSESLLQEVSDPGHFINQNNRGSCAATSVSFGLANSNPAEYARLQTDLSTKGSTRLADGSTMTVPADAFAQDSSNRSTGERLLQSAFMQYAHPTSTYHNAWNPPKSTNDPTNPSGVTVDGFDDRTGSGLFANEENHLLHGLYNQDFKTYTGSWNPFTSGKTERVEEAQRQLNAGHGPVLADIDWGSGGHAVEITAVRDGRVFFRNPWGGNDASNYGVGPTGSTSTTPPIRTDDGYEAVQSMSLNDFKARVRNVHIPD
jgi:peptidoglycan hydrolase-like protein with peptidoglycan-binding domain